MRSLVRYLFGPRLFVNINSRRYFKIMIQDFAKKTPLD